MNAVQGCSIYYNVFLSKLGLPLVFECTGDSRISSPREFYNIALEASRLLSELLELSLAVGELKHWEYIGKRFNLYAFSLTHKGSSAGQIRVVETGGLLVSICGVLTADIESYLSSEPRSKLLSGSRISFGYNIGTTYLKSVSKEWPSGQTAVPRYVVYAAEGIPSIGTETWALKITGIVSRELNITLEELKSKSTEFSERDFHCVTGWSVRGNRWIGVRLADLAKEAGLSSKAKWVVAVSVKGYSTVIPVEEALREDSIVAIGLNSKPLTLEAGYPARLVVPRLYGWKSAKWLKEIVFLEDYLDGYWEALAYHERGLVEAEERFKVRNPTIAERRELPENPKPIKPQAE